MKKLIALATLLFAFTISANAQDKKATTSPEEAAKKDLAVLNSKMKLSEDLQRDFYALLVSKHQQLNNKPDMVAADKEKMAKRMEAKMTSALTEEQKKALASDPALLKTLTQ